MHNVRQKVDQKAVVYRCYTDTNIEQLLFLKNGRGIYTI